MLFLIYINDLASFRDLNTILFADDSTFLISEESSTSLLEAAYSGLRVFQNLCVANRLTINTNKTYYMLFINRRITKTLPLKYDSHTINPSKRHKLLGATFDEDAAFQSRLSELNIKLSRIISRLYQFQDLMPIYAQKIPLQWPCFDAFPIFLTYIV